MTYDIAFLVIFTLGIIIFLYKRRKNLQRQGILFIYRTKLGIRFIDWISKKFPKTLKLMSYLVLVSGYILMTTMIYLVVKFSIYYITSPIAAEVIKVPVVIPLIPYLPEIFKLDYLPPFYFTYWIIVLAVVAIPHEFAHGIFARLNKIKILSTGFGFLGPLLAAFVEPDEKHMAKTNKFALLSILAAGTFANVIFTILFGVIFWLFFSLSFTPAGAIFNTYAVDNIKISDITTINNVSIKNENIISLIDKKTEIVKVKLKLTNEEYYIPTQNLITAYENKIENVIGILSSPAYEAGLKGAIIGIDGVKIKNYESLGEQIQKHSPGDVIKITTIQSDSKIKEYEIRLSEKDGRAFLGIGISKPDFRGITGFIYKIIFKFKDPFIYYESALGNFGWFIYYLLWWIILISISVALVNMLPLGIFDGGRFFMLTIWSLTGSKKIGENAFKISTFILLFLVIAMMVRWLFIFF